MDLRVEWGDWKWRRGIEAALSTQPDLSVSIVIYRPNEKLLRLTVESLAAAARKIAPRTVHLALVDNTPEGSPLDLGGARFQRIVSRDHLRPRQHRVRERSQFNLVSKFGRFHLVLNPDVQLAPNSLEQALDFMDDESDCGLVVPSAFHANGDRNYLCKRYPSILDLFLRGFAPRPCGRGSGNGSRVTKCGISTGDQIYWDPPIVSGCFMFFRSTILKEFGWIRPAIFPVLRGFRSLSSRPRNLRPSPTFQRSASIHFGGDAVEEGIRHIAYFMKSAFIFFSTHGWKIMMKAFRNRLSDPADCCVRLPIGCIDGR